jgi:phosphoribosyl-ATP pyrophosphohydrolase/phosphoribosyl-AMP cyclohydrolase
MVAHADREALERTQATGEMHYRSRTRGSGTRGDQRRRAARRVALHRLRRRCGARTRDAGGCGVPHRVDVVLRAVRWPPTRWAPDATIARRPRGRRGGGATPPRAQHAVAQHGGAATAIAGRTRTPRDSRRARPDRRRRAAPSDPARQRAQHGQSAKPSYTQRLLTDRNLRLKKLGEEMAELVTACADADPARAVEEGADVLYHALVALRAIGVTLDDVRRELGRRPGNARVVRCAGARPTWRSASTSQGVAPVPPSGRYSGRSNSSAFGAACAGGRRPRPTLTGRPATRTGLGEHGGEHLLRLGHEVGVQPSAPAGLLAPVELLGGSTATSAGCAPTTARRRTRRRSGRGHDRRRGAGHAAGRSCTTAAAARRGPTGAGARRAGTGDVDESASGPPLYVGHVANADRMRGAHVANRVREGSHADACGHARSRRTAAPCLSSRSGPRGAGASSASAPRSRSERRVEAARIDPPAELGGARGFSTSRRAPRDLPARVSSTMRGYALLHVVHGLRTASPKCPGASSGESP